jgi:N-acetyl-anhydromuramyl-L-alanine amidase AmpD
MPKPPAPPYLGPAAHVSAGDNKPIRRIVIHGTVSPCRTGQARATARYFRSPAAGGSAQYVVDPGEVIQCVYDGQIAQHAPPNAHSLGVELCDPQTGPADRWDDRDHRAMLILAAHLVAQLCLAYDVPIRKLTVADLRAGHHGICGHVDVSRAFKQSTHTDPGTGFPWKRFISQVAGFVTAKPPVKPKPKPAAKPNLEEDDVMYQLYDASDGRGLFVVTVAGATHVKNEVHLAFLRFEGRVSRDVKPITPAQLTALLERE